MAKKKTDKVREFCMGKKTVEQMLSFFEQCTKEHIKCKVKCSHGNVLYLDSDGVLYLIKADGTILTKNDNGKVISTDD